MRKESAFFFQDASESDDSLLVMNHGGRFLTCAFDPSSLCSVPSTGGRLYHSASDNAGGFGLVADKLAIRWTQEVIEGNGGCCCCSCWRCCSPVLDFTRTHDLLYVQVAVLFISGAAFWIFFIPNLFFSFVTRNNGLCLTVAPPPPPPLTPSTSLTALPSLSGGAERR